MVESGAGEVMTTHSSVEEWWADGVRADAQWSFWLCFPFRRVSPLFFVHILFRLGPGGLSPGGTPGALVPMGRGGEGMGLGISERECV